MKRLNIFLVLACAFIFFGLMGGVSADQANNSANEVYQCGTLDVAGIYTMNQSITSASGHCITPSVDDIIFDLNGKTINAVGGSSGVFINGLSNISIRNGIVSGGSEGILSEYSNDTYFYNITTIDSTDGGIEIVGSINATIDSCNASGVVSGLGLKFADSEHNAASDSSYNGTIKNSFSSDNLGPGIWIKNSENMLVYNNTLENNGGGIWILGGSSNNLSENIILDSIAAFGGGAGSGYGGIFFTEGAVNNTISGGFINNSVSNGICLGGGSNNTFVRDVIITNTNLGNGENNDVYVGNGSFTGPDGGPSLNVTLVNVTYNISKETVASAAGYESELIRKWYVDVVVNDSDGYLSSAGVNVTNVSGSNVFSELTGLEGNVSRMELVEYVNLAGDRTFATPHTINISKSHFILNSTSYNFTSLRETGGDLGTSNIDHNVLLLWDSGLAFDINNNVYQCGTIDGAGTYNLNQSFDYSGDATCIDINANGVTLDLMGYTVSGDSGYGRADDPPIYRGVEISGYNDSVIMNGTLTGFAAGIYIYNGDNHTILNVNSSRNSAGDQTSWRHGAFLNNVDNSYINDSLFYGNYYGVYFYGASENNTVVNNTFSANLLGGFAHHAGSEVGANSNIFNNSFIANTRGLQFNNAINYTINNNNFSFNGFVVKINTDTVSGINLSSNFMYKNTDIAEWADPIPDYDTLFSNNRIEDTLNQSSHLFVASTQNSTTENQIDFNLTMKYLNTSVCSTCTLSLSLYPNESSFSYSQSGENISGNFTPTKTGLYSLKYNVTDPDGNYESKKYIFLINVTAEDQVDYYFRNVDPTHYQPANIPRDDAGILSFDAPTDCECTEELNCTDWVQLAANDLPPYLFGVFNQVNYSVWYNISESSNKTGLERYGRWDDGVNMDVQTDLVATGDIVNENFNFSINWANNYFWTWYWFSIKLRGGFPHVYSNSTHPSFANITYSYSNTPAIRSINDTDTQLLAAYMDSNESYNATIVLDGDSATDISIEMPITSVTYLVLYDGVACTSSTTDCTLTSQSNGILNITTALGSEHNLTIYYNEPAAVEEEETTTSGGGGVPNYNPSVARISEGYTQSLGSGWKVNFEVDDESHSLRVDSIENDSVTITVSSDPVTVTLFVNESKKLDLDNDGFYDLFVRLNSLTSLRADVTIQEIDEEIEVEDVSSDESKEDEEVGRVERRFLDSGWFFLTVVGVLWVLFVSVVLFFAFLKKKKKTRRKR